MTTAATMVAEYMKAELAVVAGKTITFQGLDLEYEKALWDVVASFLHFREG